MKTTALKAKILNFKKKVIIPALKATGGFALLVISSAIAYEILKPKYPKETTVKIVPVSVTTYQVFPATESVSTLSANGTTTTTTLSTNQPTTATTSLENNTQTTTTLITNQPTTTTTSPENNTSTTTTPETQITTTTETQPATTTTTLETPQPTTTENQPATTTTTEIEISALPETNLKTIEPILTELKAQKTPEGIKINIPENILFEFDKYNVRANAKTTLSKINQLLTHYKNSQILIYGHTDNKGENDYNLELSQKRAAAVKYYFVNNFKIAPTLIFTKGYGETKPIAPNNNPDNTDNPKGREKNRRVEFIIKTTGQPPQTAKQSTDPFQNAVNNAMNAGLITQTAKTQQDWEKVALKWQQAIELMQKVPPTHSNYKTAQQKAIEYQKNLNYAQTQADLAAE